jgi:hypothetical protein
MMYRIDGSRSLENFILHKVIKAIAIINRRNTTDCLTLQNSFNPELHLLLSPIIRQNIDNPHKVKEISAL